MKFLIYKIKKQTHYVKLKQNINQRFRNRVRICKIYKTVYCHKDKTKNKFLTILYVELNHKSVLKFRFIIDK